MPRSRELDDRRCPESGPATGAIGDDERVLAVPVDRHDARADLGEIQRRFRKRLGFEHVGHVVQRLPGAAALDDVRQLTAIRAARGDAEQAHRDRPVPRAALGDTSVHRSSLDGRRSGDRPSTTRRRAVARRACGRRTWVSRGSRPGRSDSCPRCRRGRGRWSALRPHTSRSGRCLRRPDTASRSRRCAARSRCRGWRWSHLGRRSHR